MGNNTTQKERLNELALYMGMSVRKLAQLVGVSEATIYHITDTSPYKMSERTVSRICYNLEKLRGVVVNRKWLYSGEGEMINEGLQEFEKEAEATPKAADVPLEYGDVNWKERYYALLEDHIELQKKYAALLESRQQ